MTPELIFGLVGLLIGILSVGAALAWLIVAGQASLRRDLASGWACWKRACHQWKTACRRWNANSDARKGS